MEGRLSKTKDERFKLQSKLDERIMKVSTLQVSHDATDGIVPMALKAKPEGMEACF